MPSNQTVIQKQNYIHQVNKTIFNFLIKKGDIVYDAGRNWEDVKVELLEKLDELEDEIKNNSESIVDSELNLNLSF